MSGVIYEAGHAVIASIRGCLEHVEIGRRSERGNTLLADAAEFDVAVVSLGGIAACRVCRVQSPKRETETDLATMARLLPVDICVRVHAALVVFFDQPFGRRALDAVGKALRERARLSPDEVRELIEGATICATCGHRFEGWTCQKDVRRRWHEESCKHFDGSPSEEA